MMDASFDFSPMLRAFRAADANGIDLAPVLKKIGREWNDEAKGTIREGNFTPLAESTQEHRRHTGTSKITKHGHVRKSYERQLEAEAKRMRGLIRWSQRRYLGLGKLVGIPASAQARIERWQKRLAALNKQIEKSQEQWYEERKTGKSQAEQQAERPILGRIPSAQTYAVKTKGYDFTLIVANRIAWSGAHNDGATVGRGAHLPQRQWLFLTQAKIDEAGKRLAGALVATMRDLG